MTFTPCTAHTWSDRGSLVGGIGMAAVALRDGTVLLCGGCSRSDYTVGTAHAWLCGTDSWISSLPAPMTRIRWGHSATLLKDGRVLIAGLGRERDADAQTAEIYDPVKKTFTATGPMVQPRWPVQIPPPVATPNSPRQGRWNYAGSVLMARRLAASFRR